MPKRSFSKRLKSGFEKVGNLLTRSSESTGTAQRTSEYQDLGATTDTPRSYGHLDPSIRDTPAGPSPGSSIGNLIAYPPLAFEPSHASRSLPSSRRNRDRESIPQAPAFHSAPSSKRRVHRDARTWLVGLQNVLAVIERASDVFPPLKSTVAGIGALLDAKDAFSNNQEEFEKLAERVKILEEILSGRSDDDLPQGVKDRIDGLKISIETLGRTLAEKTSRNGVTRVAYTREDQQEIVRLVREITLTIELAMLDVTVRNDVMILKAVKGIDWLKERTIMERLAVNEGVDRIAKDVSGLKQDNLFRRLGDIKGFGYTRGGRRNGCVPGTRITLLAQLFAWVEDPTSPHAFWLSGIAGVGKTAVTETFCRELSDRGLLGASFFCSLTSKDLNNAYLIFPSMARTLAQARPRFGEALADTLGRINGETDPLDMPLQEQYEHLIYRPAETAFQGLRQPIVLCVDAIDECTDTEALEELLNAVALQKPTTFLKVFLTSRPEYKIKEQIELPSNSRHYHSLRLHDIEHDIVQRDISLYVNRKLEKIPALRKFYGDSWPPPAVGKIVEQSGTLFIIAATFVRYIDNDRGDRVERLQSCGLVEAPALTNVEPLYHRILGNSFADLPPKEAKDLHVCLSLLVAAETPLTIDQYAGLTHLRVGRIQDLLRPLYSVLEIREKGPVTVYHASFIDCLTKYYPKVILPPPQHFPWTVDRTQAHFLMTTLCLALMDSDDEKRGLFLGVSGAVTSYRSNDEQPSKLALRPALAYACAVWGEHALAASPLGDDVESRVQRFLERKAMFWLEALSVEKRVGTRSTEVLGDLAQTTQDQNLKRFLAETRVVARTFATPINYSAPHLYLSALPFIVSIRELAAWRPSETSSTPSVRALGGNERKQQRILALGKGSVACVSISPDGANVVSGDGTGRVRMWNTLSGEEFTTPFQGPRDDVYSIAYSPDGSKLVAGCRDGTLCVWDTKSGKKTMESYEGHTQRVNSVAFSPDGSKLVSGSSDQTIRVWEVEKGKPMVTCSRGHLKDIVSVAFSPDGSKIVSGSYDTTIRVWDAETGIPMMEPFEGHTDYVTSVAFSPDGSRIVSASHDYTIRLWDAETGKLTMGPLKGHKKDVNCVAFSADGSKVVSGSSDTTLRVWDAETGSTTMGPLEGHTGWVTSIALPLDGSTIVSGSSDGTVRVWDIEKGKPSTTPSLGHSKGVTSVAFSADGSKIVSGSYDNTIRVWDAESGKPAMDPLEGHTNTINSVTFSPDGSTIVSGSWDKTIRIWDAESGKLTMKPLQGHTNWVTSVAFSPDGSKVVSGSDDQTVRIWDIGEGEPTMKIFDGHMDLVCSVAFSPDGSKVVSGSYDSTICVWDVESGRLTIDPLEGHRETVNSVAFSSDGSKIVSGSWDRSVRVWDVNCGRSAFLLSGHEGWVTSVAFSPDGSMIASGSRDKTIRLWDVKSKKSCMTPLVGHADVVASVAFSPNGTKIVSGSRDGTIRVWDVAGSQTVSPASHLHHFPAHSLSLNDSGWICNAHGDLLLWIPFHLRPFLHIQPLQYIIGGALTEVDITLAVHHGPNWRKCMQPQREGTEDGEPWPVEY